MRLFIYSYIAEYQVTSSGTTEPRNSRESVIFDYFNALKMGDYESAYQLVYPEAHQNSSSFTSAMSKNRYALPKIISIGKEKKRKSDGNAVCDYTYIRHYRKLRLSSKSGIV